MRKIRSNLLAASSCIAVCMLVGVGNVFADPTGDPATPNYKISAETWPSGSSQNVSPGEPLVSGQVELVPEPTSAGCFLLGLGALVCLKRFKIGRRI
jgi:hypothetical protein